MKDRLIELLKQIDFDYSEECVLASENGYRCAPDFAEYFADHLLANGIIVPPVKVGDAIFATPINERNIYEFEVATITIEPKNSPIKYSYLCYGGWSFADRHWGKTVFLTKEEAEKALKERSEK